MKNTERYTEEELIAPIHNILVVLDRYVTTREIIDILKKQLKLSKEDKKILRGNTTRFERTVHNAVSHRTFHSSPDGKRIVEISPTISRITVMKVTSYGKKIIQKRNRAEIKGK